MRLLHIGVWPAQWVSRPHTTQFLERNQLKIGARQLDKLLIQSFLVVQDVIVSERRFQYEAEVASNPLNYDAWFDYVRLEEAAGDPERVRTSCMLKTLSSLTLCGLLGEKFWPGDIAGCQIWVGHDS